MIDKLPKMLLLLGIVALGAHPRMAAAEETDACLACHADKGYAIEFPQGERIEAYVDERQFKASVHSFLACTDCHDRSLTGKGHEQRRFRSEEFFKLRYSRICRRCHLDKEISGSAVHVSLLEQEAVGHAPVCTDCHPAHSVMPIAGGKILAGEETHCLGCHAAQALDAGQAGTAADADTTPRVAHGSLSCSACHAGYSSKAHPEQGLAIDGGVAVAPEDVCRRCHFDKYTKSLEGIHYDLLSRGNPRTPGCIDCHGSHQITSLSYDRGTSAAKCRECHPKLYTTYANSVHGDALVNSKNQDVPICSDCHRAHDTGDPLSVDYRDDIPVMCSNCHASEAVAGKYGLSTDVVKTYLSDFHGSTVSIYRKQRAGAYRPQKPIAVCTDCHGTHDIKSISVLGAGEVKSLLLRKCQQCHERASGDFPDAWLSHYLPSMSSAPALFIVDRAYTVLVPLILLGMLLQVLLHIWRHVAGQAGTMKSATAKAASSGLERIRRFSTPRVAEHFLLMLLFLVLAATGLAQKFHDVDVSQWLMAVFGGVDTARDIHHYAGAALAALLLLHLVTAALGVILRKWRPSMLISPQDLRDAVHNIRYYLGQTSSPAACDRYDYKQKFTYWLVLTGGLIMVLTGFILWFPVAAARQLPGEAIALAASMHSHQALVVFLLVAVWHVYDAIFSPEIFPLDTSIFTGHTTRARMRRLHPRELERLEQVSEPAPAGEPPPAPGGSGAG